MSSRKSLRDKRPAPSLQLEPCESQSKRAARERVTQGHGNKSRGGHTIAISHDVMADADRPAGYRASSGAPLERFTATLNWATVEVGQIVVIPEGAEIAPNSHT